MAYSFDAAITESVGQSMLVNKFESKCACAKNQYGYVRGEFLFLAIDRHQYRQKSSRIDANNMYVLINFPCVLSTEQLIFDGNKNRDDKHNRRPYARLTTWFRTIKILQLNDVS